MALSKKQIAFQVLQIVAIVMFWFGASALVLGILQAICVTRGEVLF